MSYLYNCRDTIRTIAEIYLPNIHGVTEIQPDFALIGFFAGHVPPVVLDVARQLQQTDIHMAGSTGHVFVASDCVRETA